MNCLDEITIIFYRAEIIWILNNRTKKSIVNLISFIITKNDFNTKGYSSCYHYIFSLGEDFVINKKLPGLYFVSFIYIMKKHAHRLRSCCGLIQQRSIGNGQSSKIAHHCLKIQKTFQTSLRNFRLVGRILSVPTRVFKNITKN